MLPFGLILLTLSGVFAQIENWAVFYPPSKVCAVRGFNVVLPCNYSYPQNHLVIQTLWCSMKTNKDNCENPPHVYDSNSSVSSDYMYTGDNKSICTLLIHNVQYHHSAEYRFRFITNVTKGKWTGKPGVTLEVADLNVSLIRISGNGTIKEGDSLNLTCDLNCTHAPSQFIWSKNNQSINQSGPVLHFPNVTVRDSGNYTCTWRRNESWGSDSMFLHVEGVFTQNENWKVFYPPSKVCAVRGFDAVLPCNYSYPQNYLVNQTLWCSMKTNNDVCENPPYVYDSNSSVSSDYMYTGDNKSICTLLIHNVQYHHSAEYRFRFITNVSGGKWTGKPGVTLEVADLNVSLIRISGNGTITEGDSLNLTCDLNCTHAPSEFIWSKNNQSINQSGRVLHFPNVTVEDSGNYTCTWRRNESWGSDSIFLQVKGVFTQNENWTVSYPPSKVCAVRGFDVILPCNYSYPQNHLVNQTLWCSMKTNNGTCDKPPHVYDSSNSSVSSDYVYTGDNKSICTLLIHNVQYHHSAEYRFRFITNVTKGKWTGKPGVTLEVADLNVSLIRISGNGTITEGDSLNLTCDLNCTHDPSQFIWSKNNQNINQSGRVLHFPNVTVEDSGNYTCTWRRNESCGSENIFLHVEGLSTSKNPDQVLIWIIALVAAGVILIVLVFAAVMCCRRRMKVKPSEETNGNSGEKSQVEEKHDRGTKLQSNQRSQLHHAPVQEEDVTYATVCINIYKSNAGFVDEQKEQKLQDHSVIYSTVK